MSFRLFFLLLLFNVKSFSQSASSYDSLINKMCATLAENKNEEDSVRIKLLLSQHLFPYVKDIEEEKINDILNNIFIRAQRQCKEFGDIVSRQSTNKSDWVRVNVKPASKLGKTICKTFGEVKKYQYLETNGDTVNVTIDKGFWVDHFKDGTFSKLKFHWLDNCEFQIEFIESNNEGRKNLSMVGDKYNYQVIDKTDKYYFMSAEIVGGNQFMTFKLYYQ